MSNVHLKFLRDVRTPSDHGHIKICELYYKGKELYVSVKGKKDIYTFPLRFLLDELTKDLPTELQT